MGGAFSWLKAGLRTTKASPGNHHQEMTSVVSPQKAEHTLDLPFSPVLSELMEEQPLSILSWSEKPGVC